MATINLDELLTITDDEFTYDDEFPNSGIPQGVFSQDHFAGPVLAMFYKQIRGTDCYDRFNVGGWEEGNYHRTVDQGPRVNGPHAYMYPLPNVITAHKQQPREEILVQHGDTVILRGTEYTIVKNHDGVNLQPTA